jgi:hypothetical protein
MATHISLGCIDAARVERVERSAAGMVALHAILIAPGALHSAATGLSITFTSVDAALSYAQQIIDAVAPRPGDEVAVSPKDATKYAERNLTTLRDVRDLGAYTVRMRDQRTHAVVTRMRRLGLLVVNGERFVLSPLAEKVLATHDAMSDAVES